ncbi:MULTISPECIES: hypothetical protein [unclassified Polaromonas]|uniref:hypothetical protein n=1 Tax=unclassified Polaromonas TaxID=2638319 RepID=UPI000F088D24|nr:MULTISPECIES: hypothetical protein [unclassified Polaromonas]AYQ29310.1 hypothetical protein DT070_15540 [Polaromonas sp. SP1]QGJ19577.1 hypothetical protein F7R28_15055 [Polaromonas sp. Pch-P]
MIKFKHLATSLASLVLLAAVPLATAQAPANPTLRLRATIEKVDATSLTVKERSGEVITLVRPAAMDVSEVYPLALADIKPGSYIGTAAMPQADGSQLALEVVVFPEAARGAGEGHRPWDLRPDSTMTNATVADLAAAPSSVPGGQKLTLRYKDGEKTVIVPPGVPVVSFKPGKADENVLLVPGAKVMITAQEQAGKPTALRVIVGRNGFAPPM